MPGFMNDIKPLWSSEHRRRWNEWEWSEGGVRESKQAKELPQHLYPSRAEVLNRQGFPDILWLLYRHVHMHAHAHPLRNRRGLVLSYLKILWVSSTTTTTTPPHPDVLASHSSVTEREDNAVSVFCLPHSHLYTFNIMQAVNDRWCDTQQL